MDVAHIERVIGRAEFLLELSGRVEIAGGIHIVVVVSYGMENLQILYCIHVVQILVKAVEVGVPELVPGHIAECNGVNLLIRVRLHIFVDFRSEGRELCPVLCAVGHVHVSEIEHGMIGLVTAFVEIEIDAFAHIDSFRHLLMELRKHSSGSHFVAAWHGDEHVAVFLLGNHLVNSP